MGQGAPQDMSQFAGNGFMNQPQGNQGNYPPPPGYGPGQGGPPGMLMGQGQGMMGQGAQNQLQGIMGQRGQGMDQGPSQDISRFAGNGMMDQSHGNRGNYPPPPGYAPGGAVPEMTGQGAQGGAPQNIPQLLQQNQPAMGALPQFDLQSLMLNQSGGQGNIPIQAGARAPVAFGAPNPSGAPMLAEQVKAPPKPPTPPPQQIDYASLMSGLGFRNGGATNSQDSHTVIQNALRLLSNRN
jgi:hypothetical protein